MFIDQYYTFQNGNISFTREQGCDFAKQVADDFNPLHDKDATRFCIPGDLLFAIVLARYGLNQHMEFGFLGMVPAGMDLILPEPSAQLLIKDAQGKEYLSIRRSGDNTDNALLIDNLTRNYVEFSGHTFPDLLVPMLAEQNMMINPARPMVMYESMTIDLDRLDIDSPVLEVDRKELSTNGKRGEVLLGFNLVESGKVVGRGKKRMILSGLREYDKPVMDEAVAVYNLRKTAYLAQ
jgi:Protein of unknown function (DUF3581)